MSNSTTLPPCDWRMNVHNCHRGDIFLIIQYIALIIDSSAVLACIVTLFQRIKFLEGRIWTSSGVSSTEALLSIMVLGFSGRAAASVCLIVGNLSPGSMMVMFEVPFLLGVVAIQTFVVGVATVSSQARQLKQNGAGDRSTNFLSLPSKRTIYIAVYSQLILQFAAQVPLAYLTGRYDYPVDVMAWPWHGYHIAHNSLWSLNLTVLSIAFLYYALALMNELKINTKDTKGTVDADSGVAKQAGRLRVQFLLLGFIYGSFGIILGTFAWLRHWILYCTEFSAFLCFGWVTICSTCILVFCYVTFLSDRQRIINRSTPTAPTSAVGSGVATAVSPVSLGRPRKASYVFNSSNHSLNNT
ncbi:hypothetical protein DFS34DRAFT_696533 [Phlyctochytrium arcticum]|nr:hypothetical protein DFS34DRAFT_696533 [Phlyctochytrium arcticum]